MKPVMTRAGSLCLFAAMITVSMLAPPITTGANPPGRRAKDSAQTPGELPDVIVGKERLRSSLSIRTRSAGGASCTLVEGCLSGTGSHRVLEFDTQIINQGPADIRFGNPGNLPNLFEFSTCHGHYHLKDTLDYAITRGGSDTVSLY